MAELKEESIGKDTRTFVIVNPNQTETGTFTGKTPAQAAKKAIKSINTDGKGTKEVPLTFRIRERGTKKLHVYTGYTCMEKAPEKRPAWMKEMISASHITKIGTEEVTITNNEQQGVVITETKKVN